MRSGGGGSGSDLFGEDMALGGLGSLGGSGIGNYNALDMDDMDDDDVFAGNELDSLF